jgi:hypothetical protein
MRFKGGWHLTMIFEAKKASDELDAKARQAIEKYAGRHGLEVQTVTPRYFDWRLFFQSGLSGTARAYRVVANTTFGDRVTRLYAYDANGEMIFENKGLKRWSNGVWFDAE